MAHPGGFAISDDSAFLAVYEHQTIVLTTLASGSSEVVYTSQGGIDDVLGLCFTNNTLLISQSRPFHAYDDSNIVEMTVTGVTPGVFLRTIRLSGSGKSIAYSPSGLIAIAVLTDISLRDYASGARLRSFGYEWALANGTFFSPSSIQFTPDGARIVVGDYIQCHLSTFHVPSGEFERHVLSTKRPAAVLSCRNGGGGYIVACPDSAGVSFVLTHITDAGAASRTVPLGHAGIPRTLAWMGEDVWCQLEDGTVLIFPWAWNAPLQCAWVTANALAQTATAES